MTEKIVGSVSDFFSHPVVAGIELSDKLEVGDTVKIKGHTTDIEFIINSMQIDHHEVPEAEPGDSIGVKVPERVRKGDLVMKVTA